MKPFQTDKLPRYWDAYIRIAAELGPYARVCEVGVGPTGGSGDMFTALFPLGQVVGVDRNSPPAVWAENVRVVIAEQDAAILPELLKGEFDLIVDDASHVGQKTLNTFNLLFPMVKRGGYYVIEDWQCDVWAGQWGEAWNQGLYEVVREMIRLLTPGPDSPVDSVEYRCGLCIVHRRA